MAATDRKLEEEIDTLSAGLDTLRKEIGALVGSFGDAASGQAKTRARRARAAVGRVADRVGEVWVDAKDEAGRRGREGVDAIEQQIEDRPLISVLAAFGIGLVIGKLINR